MPNQRILVVEDETMWIELLQLWFKMADYGNVEYAQTGAKALEMAVQAPPDCLILDLVLPDQSGLEVCRKIRANPDLARIPVVLLTAHRKEKVLGLQIGADYFVAKSEKPHELMATLDAVFRRQLKDEGTLVRGALVLRSHDRQVTLNGSAVATLTPKMFKLFHVLVSHGSHPVSRGDLYRLVEGIEEPGASRALDVLLNRLRKALPEELASRIVNVKNFGYVFMEHSPSTPPASES